MTQFWNPTNGRDLAEMAPGLTWLRPVLRPLGPTKASTRRVIHRFDLLRVIYVSGRRACIKDGLFLEMIGLPHANQKETGHRHVSYHGFHQ